jgi:protein-tyrosine phosphatase
LSSVGVSREEIVADYVASAERIEAIMARLAKSPTYAADPYLTDVDGQRPRASTIEGFLDQLEAEDGGAATWLGAQGWTSADAEALRARLVED